MDTEQEKMQFLGFIGVYKESYKLIFSWRKIFSQITFTLILPLSFILLLHIQVSNTLFGKIARDSEDLTKTPPNTPEYQNHLDNVSSDWATFLLFKLLYFIVLLILFLLSTSAVVYAVASFYTGKEVTFKKVMSAVPRVWKRLMVTFLCTVVAFIVYNVMAVVVLLICLLTVKVKYGGFAILLVIGIIYLVGLVYLTTVWQLASVVTVLEDSYGYEAMMKSKKLIKGKMGLSILIVVKLNALFFLIRFLFAMVVVNGSKLFGLGSMNRTAFGVVCFMLLSHLFLLMFVIQTVLYFVCKSCHHEIVDKSALSEHLQVYECYEPLKTKDVQLNIHV